MEKSVIHLFDKLPIFCKLFILIFNCVESSVPFELLRKYEPSLDIDLGDAQLRTPELIKKYGYPCETHEIETEDGYILGVHRIPRNGKTPIVLVNGLLAGSKEWFLPINGSPRDSIGFLLPDSGFDLWLMNTRGSRYSNKHTNLSSDSPEYWDFGIDEQTYYDLPATFDYIINATGKAKVQYLGYSIGAYFIFKTLSARPEYNDKVAIAVSWAIAETNYILTPVLKPFSKIFATPEEPIKGLLDLVSGNGTMVPRNVQKIAEMLYPIICKEFAHVCSWLHVFLGSPSNGILDSTLRVATGEFPGQSSARTLIQIMQAINNERPERNLYYDFGPKKNMEKYGQEEPPYYDITKITAPIAFYSGSTDYVAPHPDIRKMIARLRNVVRDEVVNYPHAWGHVSYIMDRNAPTLLYKPMIHFLNRYAQ